MQPMILFCDIFRECTGKNHPFPIFPRRYYHTIWVCMKGITETRRDVNVGVTHFYNEPDFFIHFRLSPEGIGFMDIYLILPVIIDNFVDRKAKIGFYYSAYRLPWSNFSWKIAYIM